jgi:hypothetical protein
MSLTEKAEFERMWGRYPKLGNLLGKKSISGKWYGASTASDNIFDRFNRLLQIVALVSDNTKELNELINSKELNSKEIDYELHLLGEELEDASNKIQLMRNEIKSIRRTTT